MLFRQFSLVKAFPVVLRSVIADGEARPLLGLFDFGIFTRRRLHDKAAPLVCVASPLICLLLATHSPDWFGGYRIGFELLIYNALLSFLGFLLFSRK